MATLPRSAPAAHAPVLSTASDGALVTNYPMAPATGPSTSIPATEHHVRNANTAEPAEFPGCHIISIPRTRGPRPRPLELTQAWCFKEKSILRTARALAVANIFCFSAWANACMGAAAQHLTYSMYEILPVTTRLFRQHDKLHVFLCLGRLYCT
jgi:hypothetical protein